VRGIATCAFRNSDAKRRSDAQSGREGAKRLGRTVCSCLQSVVEGFSRCPATLITTFAWKHFNEWTKRALTVNEAVSTPPDYTPVICISVFPKFVAVCLCFCMCIYLCISLSLSLYVSVCLRLSSSVCVCLCHCLSFYISVCHCLYLSFSLYVSVYLSVNLCHSPCFYLHFCFSACPFLRLSL